MEDPIELVCIPVNWTTACCCSFAFVLWLPIILTQASV